MKNKAKYFLLFILSDLTFSACNNSIPADEHKAHEPAVHADSESAKEGMVWLTPRQQKAIGLELGRIEKRNLSTSVKVTGRLALPPQYKAVVSTFMGGNVKKVNVIEGDYVKKGEVLAVLEHPDYIELQQNFQQVASSLVYLEKEYQRKKTLYEKEVSSAKDYQKAAAEFRAARANYQGVKKKLLLLGFNPEAVQNGKIASTISVRSPIAGYINDINLSIGEYVAPEASLFAVTNNAHVHADFIVYEKDVHKIKKGQLIRFTVANMPDKILQAKIFSIGKTFENEPRAIHVHADIVPPGAELIPGMYVNGRLQVNNVKVKSLPQEAVVSEGNKHYIFIKKSGSTNTPVHKDSATAFQRMEITTGVMDQGFMEINLLHPLSDSIFVVTSGAYRLLADMTKEENEHAH